MKKPSSIVFINVGILATIATIASLAIITPCAVAQTTAPRTGNQDMGTTTTYERNNDYSGLWGLTGLAGLFGLLGRRQEKDRFTTRRDDTPVYRDPNIP
jgi:hypothetical protein